MAITSSSQILNKDSVYAATSYLNEAIGYLTTAKSYLNSGLNYSNEGVFLTNTGNPIPSHVKDLLTSIDERISEIKALKKAVEARANEIYNSEYAEYQRYLKEQEEKAKAEQESKAEATNVPYKGDTPTYDTVPYESSNSSQVVYL